MGQTEQQPSEEFEQAMAAYRKAKATGDRAAIAEAERHLQDVTRAQLAEFERSQGRDRIPHQDIHGGLGL